MAICGHDRPIIKVTDALGLRGHEITRVVIDIKCDDVVRVYVQKFLKESEVEPLAEALKSSRIDVIECDKPIVIDDKGNII